MIPDLPTDIQELMLKACSQKNAMSPKFRVELHPLDNGEIVLARTKKTQLILRTLNALFFAGAIYPTVKMAITAASIPTKTTPIPPVVLADNLLQSMKSSRKHLLRFILWEKLGYL
jgi:hypothetical protein